MRITVVGSVVADLPTQLLVMLGSWSLRGPAPIMIHPGGKHSRRGPAPIVIHLGLERRVVPTRRTHFDGRTWPVRLPIGILYLHGTRARRFVTFAQRSAPIVIHPGSDVP